jgi:hypothetical protein
MPQSIQQRANRCSSASQFAGKENIMFRKSPLFAAAFAVAALVVAPQAHAQQKGGSTINMSRTQTINQLKSDTGVSELKCTGGIGHMTCTSKVAWVCPSGWKACSAAPGGTCCTQK